MLKCINCQQELFGQNQKKFCSKSCAATINNKGKRRHSKPESRYSTVKSCKTCGKTTARPVYCSDECNPRKKTHLTEEQKYKLIRARKNEAWARYMAKKKNIKRQLTLIYKPYKSFITTAPMDTKWITSYQYQKADYIP